MANINEIHRQMVESWNRRDWTTYRSLLHPKYEYRGGDGKTITGGPDQGVEIAKMYATAFPDGRLEIQTLVAHGSHSVAEFLATGTHNGPLMGIPPTGNRLTLPIANIVELKDGKVYREHEYFDSHHMLVQLGLAEPPK